MSIVQSIGSGFRRGLCTQFNGVDQYAYVDNPSFRFDMQGAVLAWIYRLSGFASNDTNKFCGIGHRAGSWNAYRTECSIVRSQSGHGPGVPALMTNDGTNGATYASTADQNELPALEWKHVAWVQDGVEAKLYVDGVECATQTVGAGDRGLWWNVTGGSDTVRFTLGCGWFASSGSQNGFPGSYTDCRGDEVTILSSVPTDQQIAALYGTGTPRNVLRVIPRADIRAHWCMGDAPDSAGTISDRIGPNHLTTVNGPTYVAP